MTRDYKDIIVAGGGTAGFITALILKANYGTNVNVKMIVPSNIGIIGVGEGSTEHFDQFRQFLQINEEELLKETKGSLKAGIKFENWMKDKTYYHVLSADFKYTLGADENKIVEFNAMTGETDNAKWMPRCFIDDTVQDIYAIHDNKIKLKVNGLFQFHFNTFELNNYLHKLAKKWNIEVIDDEIIDVKLDEQGYIDKLICKKGEQKGDFYIDSTGFRRVLITKLGAKWISYGDQLPLKEAIAFPTGDEDRYPITTLAKAMNSGWRWRIPTQGRFGNGYIYDTDFINKDQAVDEVQKEMGHDINVAKNIKFDPGALDKVWIKNCYAVGLSANFVEPLEATSIGSSINQAFIFMHYLPGYSDLDIKLVNNRCTQLMENVRDFIRLHYINDRRDTPFWRKCAELPMSDTLKEMLEVWKNGKLLRAMDKLATDHGQGTHDLFRIENFNMIAAHHNLINRKKLKTYFESKNELAMRGFWETYAWTKFRNTPSYIAELPHKEYLKQLGDTMDHNKVVFPNVKLQTFDQWKEHYKQTYSKVDK